jgi:protein-S-isoprenylcysteine O-methyltransferase Ste14
MKERKGEHPFGDAGQLILLGIFLIVWIGDSFFLRAGTDLLGHVLLAVRLVLCALCLVVGFLLFRSAHFVVAHEDRPQAVVRTGAFRYVRHPLYLAALLVYLGLTISTLSVAALVTLAAIFVFYDYIAGYEEKLLLARFGEDYQDYRECTGKWMPRLSARS